MKMFSSPLQRAITRGMQPSGNLATELRKLDDYPIRSRNDAEVICEALRKFPLQSKSTDSFSSPLHALIGLFQDVEGPDAPAFDVLYHEGQRELIRILDANIDSNFNANIDGELDDSQDANVDDLLFVLKILAMYGSREGAEKVVQAARRPLKPDGYMWHVILSAFSQGHPQQSYVFDSLSDPLPSDFIAIALLDSANGTAINSTLSRHPFDSPAGWQRLQSWLEDRDPDHFSYAHSATAALPFVSQPYCDQLLALAMDHIDAGVQREAAWAAGKMGREAGLKMLARFCLDVNHSEVARRYLVELGREDVIPIEATEPAFQAKAELAGWLAHPNELGQSPDELDILDHRLLAWPPEREPIPLYLIRYQLRDRTGLEEDEVDCGLVGSVTWSFLSYKMHQRPPEDAYAIHCYWEMANAGLITEAEVADPAEYAALLGQWQGSPLHEPTITWVAELSHELQIPGRLVALASAQIDGQDGSVVLDGPRSSWYPKSDQPQGSGSHEALMIHVGRQLLGFQDQPDRKKYLIPSLTQRQPQAVIAAYERAMAEAATAPPSRQRELLSGWSLLSRKIEDYHDAVTTVRGVSRSEVVIEVYERFLQLAQTGDESTRRDAHDIGSVLGEQFDNYVEALEACGRSAEVGGLIQLFATYWDNNSGYGQLGRAAFKIGDRESAERYFQKLRDGMEGYYRAEEMSLLAEIWSARGEAERARELLIDCMRRLRTEIEASEYISDRKMFSEQLAHHRATFVRLFPEGETALAELGIPEQPRV